VLARGAPDHCTRVRAKLRKVDHGSSQMADGFETELTKV
jgi:hypothetical protein